MTHRAPERPVPVDGARVVRILRHGVEIPPSATVGYHDDVKLSWEYGAREGLPYVRG
jgi:hypothetical protein